MPATAPIAYATLSNEIPSRPYVLGITPSSSSPHLLLRHPSSEITIADNQSLQPIDTLRGGHSAHVSAVCSEGGAIWSSGKEGNIVRWDERSRNAGMTIKAFVRKPLPVLALTVSERDNLVIGGTELVSSEAHILYWDTRNAKQPLYAHSSTHSDDLTHLSLLPQTSTYLPPSTSSSSSSIPNRLLLSSSTDGLIALSNPFEADEEEAVVAAENWGQSIANVGWYEHKGKMKIWGRSDMDGVATWSIGRVQQPAEDGEGEGELEFTDTVEQPTEKIRGQSFKVPKSGPNVVRDAAEERGEKKEVFTSEYLVDVVPSLGVGKKGTPIIGLGSNDGDMVLTHNTSNTAAQPSAFFLSGPGPARGHKDVIRAIYHDRSNEAIYTGSEDGILSGWSLASLPSRLLVGDPEVDDDGGDGREDIRSEDEGEESEIRTESEDESDEMDVDDDEDEAMESGPRNGPILGRGAEDRKERRKRKRTVPY